MAHWQDSNAPPDKVEANATEAKAADEEAAEKRVAAEKVCSLRQTQAHASPRLRLGCCICTCVYVCGIQACMRACRCLPAKTRTRAHKLTRTQARKSARPCTLARKHTHSHRQPDRQTQIHTRTHTYTYTQTHTHTQTHANTHTHTLTHTHKRARMHKQIPNTYARVGVRERERERGKRECVLEGALE